MLMSALLSVHMPELMYMHICKHMSTHMSADVSAHAVTNVSGACCCKDATAVGNRKGTAAGGRTQGGEPRAQTVKDTARCAFRCMLLVCSMQTHVTWRVYLMNWGKHSNILHAEQKAQPGEASATRQHLDAI